METKAILRGVRLYIHMDDDKCITLTDSGREIAEKMYQRHLVLAKFLMRLGVREETAFADACRMEHDISAETFAAINRHAEKGWEYGFRVKRGCPELGSSFPVKKATKERAAR